MSDNGDHMLLPQQRALSFARQICHGHIRVEDLSSDDWELLTLAAELTDLNAAPDVVACRVIKNAENGTGIFKDEKETDHSDGDGLPQ